MFASALRTKIFGTKLFGSGPAQDIQIYLRQDSSTKLLGSGLYTKLLGSGLGHKPTSVRTRTQTHLGQDSDTKLLGSRLGHQDTWVRTRTQAYLGHGLGHDSHKFTTLGSRFTQMNLQYLGHDPHKFTWVRTQNSGTNLLGSGL